MRTFGLLGFPLGHSFSQKYFTKKFEDANITDCKYQLFSIENEQSIPDFLGKNLAYISGFNVTIPYKQAILNYLDEITPDAAAIGAVNCVKVTNNQKLVGFNTDVYGFEISLLDFIGHREYIKKALILGTGGSSKAVKYVLRKNNIPFTSVSRTPQKDCLTYENLDPTVLSEYQLIVNTTPLGMSPNTNFFPNIQYSSLGAQHYLYDLIYNPEKTLFLERGEMQNCKTKNGLEMLYLQAEKSWEIWNSL